MIAMCCVPLGYLFPLGKNLTPLGPCSAAVVLVLTHSHLAVGVLACLLQGRKRLQIADHYAWKKGSCECCQIFIKSEHFITLEHFIILSMTNFPLPYKGNPDLLNT